MIAAQDLQLALACAALENPNNTPGDRGGLVPSPEQRAAWEHDLLHYCGYRVYDHHRGSGNAVCMCIGWTPDGCAFCYGKMRPRQWHLDLWTLCTVEKGPCQSRNRNRIDAEFCLESPIRRSPSHDLQAGFRCRVAIETGSQAKKADGLRQAVAVTMAIQLLRSVYEL
jgi:hypothetical protein